MTNDIFFIDLVVINIRNNCPINVDKLFYKLVSMMEEIKVDLKGEATMSGPSYSSD